MRERNKMRRRPRNSGYLVRNCSGLAAGGSSIPSGMTTERMGQPNDSASPCSARLVKWTAAASLRADPQWSAGKGVSKVLAVASCHRNLASRAGERRKALSPAARPTLPPRSQKRRGRGRGRLRIGAIPSSTSDKGATRACRTRFAWGNTSGLRRFPGSVPPIVWKNAVLGHRHRSWRSRPRPPPPSTPAP